MIRKSYGMRRRVLSIVLLVAPLTTFVFACGGATEPVGDANQWQTEPSDQTWPPAPTPSTEQPAQTAAPSGSSSGYCTTTAVEHSPAFGGLKGGDAICQRELPGSHFYRRSLDALRRFQPAKQQWLAGYGEIEAGDTWNCRGWTAEASGSYEPKQPGHANGYATVAALVPSTDEPTTGAWRICEGANWPLTCCFD